MSNDKAVLTGSQSGAETAVAEYIRRRGVTRCPTACVLPTQASVAAADRAALAEYAEARDRLRQAKATARERSLWDLVEAPLDGEVQPGGDRRRP